MSDNTPAMSNWTPRESTLLEETEKLGIKPVAKSLVASLFSLYLEGYSCAEISKQGKGLSEGDILGLRKKYNWDEEKARYIADLNTQIRDKLIKAKLETIEFITNTLAVHHKKNREQALKYLQTGNEEDLPKDQVNSLRAYKELIQTLQSVTGEDKVQIQKHQVDANIKTENINPQPNGGLTPELQSLLLKKLLGE